MFPSFFSPPAPPEESPEDARRSQDAAAKLRRHLLGDSRPVEKLDGPHQPLEAFQLLRKRACPGRKGEQAGFPARNDVEKLFYLLALHLNGCEKAVGWEPID